MMKIWNFSIDLDHEEEAVQLAISNNNLVIQYLLNQQENQAIHGGSVPGRCFIHRDRESAHDRLFNDYFSETPKYNDILFRRRYRMSRSLFLRILHEVEGHDNYFTQRRDTMGRLGLSSIQKVTVVFRMLAYGLPADVVDEYIKIGESTTIESMKNFCRAIVEIFSAQYLRSPTTDDVSRLLYIGEKQGFPGMLGSLDCMHWKWKNCPTAWAGQYAGRSGSPTIILEAVADYDLWI
uniref:DDE Tnp4 domain-containing protein n=2 Tax=Brassica oleracea var. oleracea TaxID=109376 RepID=A0A0D3BUP2_BRAOL